MQLIRNKLKIIFCLLLVTSCVKNTEEDARKRYKELIEDKVWCEMDSKNKILFENGYCKKYINDSLSVLGDYKLIIEPAYGAGEWMMPNNKIKINTISGNKYFLELDVDSDQKYLTFREEKNKSILFLLDDCTMEYGDSITYVFYKNNNYKLITLK
ncbi:hypothetical protein [uncultured Polaribacter sp.]|mgnify:CR=1 FL=1|uniref:hypothetical protein n=1 Tax=uncultured Polaribacter sp. TaxID=174711 RepID=UPI0030DB054F|tara:strand:+ start:68 stop:535 length:468 start_codon:yes stop_codon:yes gene_type:complete